MTGVSWNPLSASQVRSPASPLSTLARLSLRVSPSLLTEAPVTASVSRDQDRSGGGLPGMI